VLRFLAFPIQILSLSPSIPRVSVSSDEVARRPTGDAHAYAGHGPVPDLGQTIPNLHLPRIGFSVSGASGWGSEFEGGALTGTVRQKRVTEGCRCGRKEGEWDWGRGMGFG
jgi:hypothetical protein